ncbi:hypothetical protein [Photobacterium swingsii]|uniref:hypothetical protein n=1 Tax=Photobacterium swingsii TaxID=680026 RepID=UPI00352CA7DE
MLSESTLIERLEEAKRCARILELDMSRHTIRSYIIACVIDNDIHINNIGSALTSALANPGHLLLGAFEKTEQHQKTQLLLDK